MKKIFPMLAAALTLAASVSLCACSATPPKRPDTARPAEQGNVTLEVYAPDGAPALALCGLIDGQSVSAASAEGAAVTYTYNVHVVDSSTIAGFVTGEAPKADFCILPLNIASLKLGAGDTYRMLGTVTNGNMYFLTTGSNPVLTAENLATLKGKKVGVVQLPNVPGLTLRAMLDDHDIAYRLLESAQAEGAADAVNLVPFMPDNVTPMAGCDYYLVPEPAASAKIKGTAASGNPFKDGGDLQALYGENGYPQAVMMVRNSVIEAHAAAVEQVKSYLEDSKRYLGETEPSKLIDLLAAKRTEGLTPSFNANNLTAAVVARCSVAFTASASCKTTVETFLKKLIAISPDSAKEVAENFFL